MSIESVIKIEKQYTKKDFIRELVIELTKDSTTPNDILEVDFSDVQELEKEYLLVYGNANVDYACEVGIKQNNSYNENEIVKWSPYSGSYSSKVRSFVGNGISQDNYRDSDSIEELWYLCKDKYKKEIKRDIIANSNALNLAQEDCIETCFYLAPKPGITRNETWRGTFKPENIIGIIIPEFEINYEYHGKYYRASGFATGEMQLNIESPNVSGNVLKSTKSPLKIFYIGTFILGILLNFLINKIGWWCVAAYILAYVLWLMDRKLIRTKINNVCAKNQKDKINRLKVFLQNNALKSLTDKEISILEGNDDEE